MRKDLNAQPLEPVAPIYNSYEAYGCQVNAIGVDELFRRYERSGFLYPAKLHRLEPFRSVIRENWERSIRCGTLLHYIVSTETPDAGWASVTSWRTTLTGWNLQHLVGWGSPRAPRAAMLSEGSLMIQSPVHGSTQSWYQRSNRLANKLFGGGSLVCGSFGAAADCSYFTFPLDCVRTVSSDDVVVRRCAPEHSGALRELANRTRSSVFVTGESLEDPDLELEQLDALYRKAGLRRFRKVLVAEHRKVHGLAGAALVYRGPLGLNFSMLENRCDLLVEPTLRDQDRQSVVSILLSAAAAHYEDFPPQSIPVVINQQDAPLLLTEGAQHLRNYAQSVWLQPGYEALYRHIERAYDRVIRADHRRGFGRPTPAESGGALDESA